ncbi:MAG TPA: divalent-cation tolerance protein CutA [Glycomyces sp.]|nr:divalent-cation tolerance protein CutA [Glycomyces sp.]
MTDYAQTVTTVDSEEAALALARSAVEERLAACAQVSGPITSVYRWEGRTETAREWQVAFKTTAEAYPELEAHIKARHGYDVPEILLIPVTTGNAAYLAWIDEETR